MKKLILTTMAVFAAGLLAPALAQNEAPDAGGSPPMQVPDEGAAPEESAAPPDESAPTPSGSTPAVHFVHSGTVPAAATTQTAPASDDSEAAPSGSPAEDQLVLNFDNVPLDMVLNYLSDAAGFTIIMDTQVHGNVSVISSHPMTRDQAVNLLNSVLNQNGYAAIRDGQTLTILNKDDAKTRDIPVHIGNDPESIPKNDEIVTQIIPIRYVDASQLVSDLSSFVSPQATIVANQAGNSIVITDTQENIRHLVEIVSAIDSSAAGETEIQVFHLSYANPNDVATELGNIFPSGSGTGGNQLPIRFGGGFGGGGFGGGGFGGGGGPGGFFARLAAANAGGGNSDNNRAREQSQVTAVADSRTQSIIVMASKDLMQEIAGMMSQLDVPSGRDQQVYVYSLKNADPEEALQVLENTFPAGSSANRSTSSQQTPSSALLQRSIDNATQVGQTSESISSGTSTGAGGGAGRGGTP